MPARASPSYCPLLSYNAPPTTALYTLSLHDALPISPSRPDPDRRCCPDSRPRGPAAPLGAPASRPTTPASRSRGRSRSEEHTSELQSRPHLVCRLLLEKKKKEILAYAPAKQ